MSDSVFSIEDLNERRKFAFELATNLNDPFKAGLSVFKDNVNKALRAAYEWPKDEIVILEVARLKDETGEIGLLPSKTDLARTLWNKINSGINDEDFIKASALYAQIMGFMPKKEDMIKPSASFQIVASKLDENI